MTDRKLKRRLGFWDVLFFAIGGIVGAGIYAIIGQATALSGSYVWLSFLIAALVAFLTALSYAEFVSLYPDAGGSYEYIRRSLGSRTALWLSIFMAFTGIVACAVIAISFADYLGRLVDMNQRIGSVLIIATMTVFNIFGSKKSSYYNLIATGITLAGLLLVIICSIPDWGSVSLVPSLDIKTSGILAAASLIFFSYIGFEDLVKVAEETKSPKKNMPRAIILSSVTVLLLYFFISTSSIQALGPEKLAASEGPLAAVVESEIGKTGGLIVVIVAVFATSKTILGNILGTSRLLYDVARDSDIKWMKRLTTISGIGSAPNYAILTTAAIATAFAMIGDLKVVASLSNICVFIVFGAVNIALIKHRIKKPNNKKEAHFRVPLNVKNIPVTAIIGLICLLVLFVFNLTNLNL